MRNRFTKQKKQMTLGTGSLLRTLLSKVRRELWIESVYKIISLPYHFCNRYNDGSSIKEYLYHRNIQGDILGIYDDEGKQVGGYAYDAYGHHVVTLDINGIATLNPFRYRGYFYDEETKLYYLNARYYDPETGRFISPDILSILDETKGQINGLNLYMYCGDNHTNYVYPNECLFVAIASLIIAITVSAITGGAGLWAFEGGSAVPLIEKIARILIHGIVGGGLKFSNSLIFKYMKGEINEWKDAILTVRNILMGY